MAETNEQTKNINTNTKPILSNIQEKIAELEAAFIQNIKLDNNETLQYKDREKQRIAYKKAMVKATSEFPPIPMNKTILKADGSKYNYADLNIIIESTKKILAKNGLYVEFRFKTDFNTKTLSTIIVVNHEDGWSNASEPFTLKINTDDPQNIASTLTYSKRYLYNAMFNITAETDDDGSIASGRNKNKISDKPAASKNTKQKQEIIPPTMPEPEEHTPTCLDCGKPISLEEERISTRNFGVPYCLNCQSNH